MPRYTEFIPYDKILKYEIIFANSPNENMRSVYNRTGCDYMINFPIYNMNAWANGKLQNLSGIKQDGNFISKAYTGKGFGWDNNSNKLYWCNEARYYNGHVFDNFLGQMFSYKDDVGWHNRFTEPNACIGMGIYDSGIRLAGCSKESASAMNSDKFMRKYFADSKYAMEGDGSYSAQWITPSGGNYNTRNVVAYFAIWLKKEIQTPPEQEGEYEVKDYVNGSTRKPVYETTACKKQIGSLDPHEKCSALYEDSTFTVVLYNITGSSERKVGFVRK